MKKEKFDMLQRIANVRLEVEVEVEVVTKVEVVQLSPHIYGVATT